MTDYKQMCAELLAALEEEASNWNLDPECHPLVVRARAALAEPEPEGPTDEELNLLADYRMLTDGETGAVYLEHLDYARAVLARWGK